MTKLLAMIKTHSFLFCTFFATLFFNVLPTNILKAQGSKKSEKAVTYKEVYDLPSETNTLFVHFQPLYGDVYQTNVNVGFGLEAQYHLNDMFDFHIHGRTTYSQRFDHARDVAEKNGINRSIQNSFDVYSYFEGGATYHIQDHEEDASTRIVLYSKRYKPFKWAAQVPKHITVPSKVRKYYGARLGGMYYNTTTDLSIASRRQGIVLVDDEGNEVNDIFGNLKSTAVFVGGSMTWVKNFGIKPDRDFDVLINDLHFTTFLDLIIAPSVMLDDVFLNAGGKVDVSEIKTSTVGFRAGMQGKFNRTWGWAYGAEIGVRPGVAKRSFYTLIKISFPVFSTNLKHEQDAFDNIF